MATNQTETLSVCFSVTLKNNALKKNDVFSWFYSWIARNTADFCCIDLKITKLKDFLGAFYQFEKPFSLVRPLFVF